MRNNMPVGQPQPSLDDLLRDFRQGRNPHECFRALFTRFHPQVYRFFLRKGMSTEDARDLAQEVFLSVYKGLSAIQNEAHFVNWLFTIARNAFHNDLEKRRAKKRSAIHVVPGRGDEVTGLEELPAPAGPDVLQQMLDREKTEKLVAAVETLPSQMRRCVQLRVAEESTYDEIALMLGISENTVKAHLFRARKVLQAKLGSYFRTLGALEREEG